jgi:hypothetical protein
VPAVGSLTLWAVGLVLAVVLGPEIMAAADHYTLGLLKDAPRRGTERVLASTPAHGPRLGPPG